jgi:hypothetical protein
MSAPPGLSAPLRSGEPVARTERTHGVRAEPVARAEGQHSPGLGAGVSGYRAGQAEDGVRGYGASLAATDSAATTSAATTSTGTTSTSTTSASGNGMIGNGAGGNGAGQADGGGRR